MFDNLPWNGEIVTKIWMENGEICMYIFGLLFLVGSITADALALLLWNQECLWLTWIMDYFLIPAWIGNYIQRKIWDEIT